MDKGVTYNDISIPEGFITNYLKYTSKQESPTQFHFWSAVSMLSASIGRSITLRRGFYDLYPNFIIILVAGSALSRKSSAINVGIRLLRTAIQHTKEEGLGSGLTSVLGSKMTPEALCRAISLRGVDSLDMDYEELPAEAKGRPVLLFNSELGVFLSKQAQMNGMVDLLTDLYDCPDVWEYITKTQGTDIAHNIYLSLLSATTPDWLASNVSSAVFNQGFTGRTIFVFADKPQHRNAHPTLSKEERLLEASLINFLQSKFNLEGEMTLSPGAHQLFEDWYMTREDSVDSTMETGFLGREHDHVLKLAMVLSLSRSNALTIELYDIDIAIKHLNIIRRNLVNVFEDVRVAGETANVAIVEDAIKRAGASGVARSPLLRAVYRKVSKREFDEALDVLKLAGKINVDEISTGGRSKRIYKYK